MNITRIGKTTGRWPRYTLVVDGVEIGTVRRTTQGSGDRMTPEVRYDGWHVGGVVKATQADAENELIARARRFGKIV